VRRAKPGLFYQRNSAVRAASFLALLFSLVLSGVPQETAALIDPLGMTIEARFPAPAGFEREAVAGDSFAAYLRLLPLKPHGALVKLYDGRVKPNAGVYAAVVALPIGRRDLHQCADAVIRLRAEYLFARGRYEDIRFRFTNGFLAEYSRWRCGERIVVRGSHVSWGNAGRAGDRLEDFWRYLETVFSYAGTASLARELLAAPGDDPQIGDVFIQAGRPGHAVIVVDHALNRRSGREVFLLAQSYMPAQEIQVLNNPSDRGLGPWYAADFGGTLRTPEWIFTSGNRMRFQEP
jgi:hypothetical protein